MECDIGVSFCFYFLWQIKIGNFLRGYIAIRSIWYLKPTLFSEVYWFWSLPDVISILFWWSISTFVSIHIWSVIFDQYFDQYHSLINIVKILVVLWSSLKSVFDRNWSIRSISVIDCGGHRRCNRFVIADQYFVTFSIFG